VRKPEASKDTNPYLWSWIQDWMERAYPGGKTYWERKHRCYDTFQIYCIPGFSLFMYQFNHLALGFKWLTVVPWLLFYTRLRDRTLDPDMKETYLRDMMYRNPVVAKYFKEDTIHVIDYDMEYVNGFLCPEKFPEYNNKIFRFFNTDTSQTEGHFKFGDVETGATMLLKFKTMPAPGRFRYQVGEPFFFYDLRAEINYKGEFIPVTLVDENECLKKIRPFLYLI